MAYLILNKYDMKLCTGSFRHKMASSEHDCDSSGFCKGEEAVDYQSDWSLAFQEELYSMQLCYFTV
jgi:hypothetical protein